jgi:threonine aldolase
VDHQNAKRLAHGLAEMDGINIDPEDVVTNIVLFDVGYTPMDADTFAERLAPAGVLLIPFGPTTLRAVTHLDVTTAEIDKALEVIDQFLKKV